MAYKIGFTLGCRHFQIIVYRNTIYEIFHYISIDKIKKESFKYASNSKS